jgi:aminoglycoside 6'-N-acetyltransferase I
LTEILRHLGYGQAIQSFAWQKLTEKMRGIAETPQIAIRVARPEDREPLARLRAALWPESSAEEHAQELVAILDGKGLGPLPLIELVAEESSGALLGFAEVGLRSHADGCDASRAVGYLEGWYVVESDRKRGIGRKLLHAAEDWARSQGCLEMASDALLENEVSQRAHKALGYVVVDRCVRYRKVL